MDGILLDTNALLWYLKGDERMSKSAAAEIYGGIKAQSIVVSVASFWEISCFSDKKMSLFHNLTKQNIINMIKDSFLPKVISIDEKIIYHAYHLDHFHNDPADRFITATSLVYKIPLYTSDQLIFDWNEKEKNKITLKYTRKN
jgi:PIN domain nuclease of toxin-antitoxin system